MRWRRGRWLRGGLRDGGVGGVLEVSVAASMLTRVCEGASALRPHHE